MTPSGSPDRSGPLGCLRLGKLSGALLASSLVAMVARYGSVLCAFLFNAYLARQLPQDQYGTFLLMVGLVMMSELFFGCGLGEYAVRSLPGMRAAGDHANVLRLLRLTLTVGGAATLCLILIGWQGSVAELLARVTHNRLVAEVFPWALVLLVAWSANGLSGQILLGLGCGRSAPLLYYLTPKVIALAAAFCSYWGWWQWSATTALNLLTCGFLVALVIAIGVIWRAAKRRPEGDGARGEAGPSGPLRMAEVLRVSLPLMTSRLLQVATPAITLWMIAVFAPAEDVARFGSTHRLLEGLTTAFAVITFVFRPTIALLVEQGRTTELTAMCRTVSTLILLPHVVLIAAAFGWGGTMTALVYGEAYRDAGVLLAIMSLGYGIQAASGPAIEVLRLSGHHQVTLRIQLVTSGVLLILQAVCLRWFSVTAVAVLLSCYYAAISIVLAMLAARLQRTPTYCTLSPRMITHALRID